MGETEINKIKNQISVCYSIYKELFWLINSYVLDFFTENHWDKLSSTWKKFFMNSHPDDLATILDVNNELKTRKVVPLSLLALRKCLRLYNLPRTNLNYKSIESKVDINNLNKIKNSVLQNSKLMKLFWKHIKLKKRHEITIISEETFQRAVECKCEYIVDIGSGLGHLVRMLSYGYGLKVCGIEAQNKLNTQARELDAKFEATVSKYKDLPIVQIKPIHINLKIEPDTRPQEFLEVIKDVFKIKDDQFKFGIVGLHPCGDLGATLLRLYNNCDNCSFINIVSCCYMKLTMKSDNSSYGYPLSNFSRTQNFTLSYNAREVACHSIETYIERLKTGYHWELKIHAYRALIEKLIVEKWPHMKHSPLANVKYTEGLSFVDYCQKALKKHDLHIENYLIESQEIQNNLRDWYKVVVYYSLRLQMAPLLETIILLDKLIYIKENKSEFNIKSAFDPKLSPRNYIITAIK